MNDLESFLNYRPNAAKNRYQWKKNGRPLLVVGYNRIIITIILKYLKRKIQIPVQTCFSGPV